MGSLVRIALYTIPCLEIRSYPSLTEEFEEKKKEHAIIHGSNSVEPLLFQSFTFFKETLKADCCERLEHCEVVNLASYEN